MPPGDPLVTHLQAFFAGDRSSLESLATGCQVDLLRMVRGALRRRHARNPREQQHDAQEIVQAVYLALLRYRRDDQAPPIANVVAYLQGLINNAIRGLDRRGRAQRRRDDLSRSFDPLRPPPVANAPLQVARVERLDLLRTVLHTLTQVERVILVARAHGWTFPLIARRTRLTAHACRATYRRTILRLRQALEEAERSPDGDAPGSSEKRRAGAAKRSRATHERRSKRPPRTNGD